LDFVVPWKRCLCFIEDLTTRMWYLPANSIAGTVNSIDFGAQFKHGGYLAQLASWTVDGGEGVDDILIALSTEGDLCMYSGTTGPAATDFKLRGVWYVGRVPPGRRNIVPFAGDLFVLSELGFNPLSAILRGEGLVDRNKNMARVAGAIGSDVAAVPTAYWETKFIPSQDVILINDGTPDAKSDGGKQWCLSTSGLGWSTFSEWPAQCFGFFEGEAYFGTATGCVYKAFYGSADNVIVPDGEGGGASDGTVYEGKMLTAYHNINQRRQVLYGTVRLTFTSSTAMPGLSVAVNPETLDSLPAASTWSITASTGDVWDTAVWDTSEWTGSSFYNVVTYRGVAGRGTRAALAMRVKGPLDTIFVGWDLLYQSGGDL
jgi:hypothetical protein